MVRIISKDLIEINPGEVVEEIIISKKILFWNLETTYRKVHGTIFGYKKGRYRVLGFLELCNAEKYFLLPFDHHEQD